MTPAPQHRKHEPMIIPIFPSRQWTSYSCSAAVLQMVVRHFTGERLSHLAAIRGTQCRPDGCMMAFLRLVIRNRYGLRSRVIPVGIRSFRQQLNRGRLVVVDDNRTYVNSHVIVLNGHTRQRFWIVDPVIGLPTWPRCRRVVTAAQEAFAVWL